MHLSQRLREAILIITGAIALFLLLALMTYHRTDPSWSNIYDTHSVANAGGRVGAWFADVFLMLFGYLAYLFPFMLAYSAWLFLHALPERPSFDWRVFVLRGTGFLLIMFGGCALASLQFLGLHSHIPYTAGGILGSIIGPDLASQFNLTGATLLLLALLLTGITLFTGLSWLKLMDSIGRLVFVIVGGLASFSRTFSKMVLVIGSGSLRGWRSYRERRQLRHERKLEAKRAAKEAAKQKAFERKAKSTKSKLVIHHKDQDKAPQNNSTQEIQKSKLTITEQTNPIKTSLRAQKERQVPLFKSMPVGDLPPISLLDPAEPASKKGFSKQTLEQMSRDVEAKLKDFGVEVQVVAVHPGPVITRFEMELAPGIKVSRISGLAKDLARSLSVISVRIVEVIPGKSVVGLELPNEEREVVRLSEILASVQYEQMRSPLSLALGKDISGHPVIVDLAKMPHLLVAGTTGSGKSVGVNAMLMGLLYKSVPEQVRLILVDPKMLELSIYEGIPHLLTPVVTDMKEAANALRWCVGEMERRYRLMAALGVRNLSGFNHKVSEAAKKGTPIPDPLWNGPEDEECPKLNSLPFIIVVIDEFADMMMVVGKKVEQLIARIAQKARAAGIHLILATQRPSVDVITGLIKANIPTRIAFQVSSKIDSRTVLDQGGAEQLLGNGDMLYLPPGTSVPVRVHGAFVADHEVHKVVEDWKQRAQPEYLDEILQGGAGAAGDLASGESGDGDAESDPLYDEAVQIVTSTRKSSISGLQRRLKVGYNRAARLVEDMEAAGVVGPMESNGSREVLAPPPPEE